MNTLRDRWERLRLVSICWSAVVTAALSMVSMPAGEARAEGLADQVHSLRVVPADTAFYSANLRLGEQFDRFLASKAYARLMEVPFVQLAKMQVAFHWEQSREPAIAKARDYLRSPEGRQTLALVRQMAREEVFAFGSSDAVALLQLLGELNAANRTSRIEAAMTGRDPDEVLAENVYELLEEHSEAFQVPAVTLGFRIEDPPAAAAHLDHLHQVLTELLEEDQPALAERLRREQVAGHEFLTLRLDGGMIPWDEIRARADDEEQVAQWRELLSDKTAVVAIGVVGEFVLMSIADSTDHIASFGQEPVLADHPALTRLARHAGEQITSVAYVSEEFARRVSSPAETVKDWIELAEEGLEAAQVDAQQRAALVEDLEGLGSDLLKYIAAPGSYLMIGFLTERGYEAYEYRTGTQPLLDDSQPLTILAHVGGSPLLFAASRSRQSVESYDETVAWIVKVAGRVEKIVGQRVPPNDWANYLRIRDDAVSLLRRLNRATREHMCLALADGQRALVLDVGAESRQWFAPLPRSPQPLPMVEVGIVCRVSDADHLRQGVSEYFAIAEDTAALVHRIDPDTVPEIRLPRPVVLTEGALTFFTYTLPAEWGVESQVAINGGMTDRVAAVSFLPAFTSRLLQPAPLQIDTGLDMDRAAAKARHLQIAKTVDAVRPWIDYGFAAAMGNLNAERDPNDEELDGAGRDFEHSAAVTQMGFILPQVHQLLDVAAALRSHSSITYREDDAWVTHSEMHIEDLE